MKMKIPKPSKSSVKWFFIAVIITGVCIFAFSAVRELFQGIAAAIKGIFGVVNKTGKDIAEASGLDPEVKDYAVEAQTPKPDNPWNPTYWKSFTIPIKIYSSGGAQDLIARIKDAQSPWGGISWDKYAAIFQSFQSKAEFSNFCWWWTRYEGTALATWMLTGWGFGLVSAMGLSDFKRLTSGINDLPDYRKG